MAETTATLRGRAHSSSMFPNSGQIGNTIISFARGCRSHLRRRSRRLMPTYYARTYFHSARSLVGTRPRSHFYSLDPFLHSCRISLRECAIMPHRKLGMLCAILAAGVVVLGYAVALP